MTGASAGHRGQPPVANRPVPAGGRRWRRGRIAGLIGRSVAPRSRPASRRWAGCPAATTQRMIDDWSRWPSTCGIRRAAPGCRSRLPSAAAMDGPGSPRTDGVVAASPPRCRRRSRPGRRARRRPGWRETTPDDHCRSESCSSPNLRERSALGRGQFLPRRLRDRPAFALASGGGTWIAGDRPAAHTAPYPSSPSVAPQASPLGRRRPRWTSVADAGGPARPGCGRAVRQRHRHVPDGVATRAGPRTVDRTGPALRYRQGAPTGVEPSASAGWRRSAGHPRIQGDTDAGA